MDRSPIAASNREPVGPTIARSRPNASAAVVLDAERRVNAEYEISPRLSLQGATSSLGRYVLDLLFRFGFY